MTGTQGIQVNACITKGHLLSVINVVRQLCLVLVTAVGKILTVFVTAFNYFVVQVSLVRQSTAFLLNIGGRMWVKKNSSSCSKSTSFLKVYFRS